MKKYILIISGVILSIANNFASIPSWSYKSNFGGTKRFDNYGFASGIKGYVGGGMGTPSTANYNDFWEYNSSNDTWTQMASNPVLQTIQYATSFSIGTKGYVVCGNTGSAFADTDSLWIYDIPTNTWTPGPVFPGGTRKFLSSFVIGGFAYVGLGLEFDPSTFTDVAQSDFYKYDPVNNSWLPIANITGAARSNAAGFALNGFGYIVGGTSSTANLNELKQYNPATNSWIAKASHPSFIWGCVATSGGGEGYIIGAFAPFQSQLVYKYSPVTNSWSMGPDMLSGRGRGTGFIIQDTIYVTTGLAFAGPGSQPSFTTQALNIGSSVGINEIISVNNFVYPTLTSGKLFLNEEKVNSLSPSEKLLNIYSSNGQLIKSAKLNSEIDISELPNGTYLIKSSSGKFFDRIVLMK